MKLTRLFAGSLLLFLIAFSVGICIMSFTTYQEADTLPQTIVRPDSETVKLLKLKAEKDKEGEMLKDSISKGIDELGTLGSKADKVNNTLSKTANTLKGVYNSNEKDVQPIEKIYRIDTSPRPVVINVSAPYQPSVRQKGFFRARKPAAQERKKD